MRQVVKPQKNLGQNFLTSGKIAADIASAAILKPDDVVLEVGPGRGFLTKELLKAGAKVIAIEKDHTLVLELGSLFGEEIKKGQLEIVGGDVREYLKNEAYSLRYILRTTHYKLIANIPYYLTSHLITSFLKLPNPPKLIVLMVQKEVAQRMMAKNGKENLLSLAVKFSGRPEIIRLVRAGSFFPKPKVDSAVIRIKNIKRVSERDAAALFGLINKSFSQKRKKLLTTLKSEKNGIDYETLFKKCGIPPNVRAEDVPFLKWRQLSKLAYNKLDE